LSLSKLEKARAKAKIIAASESSEREKIRQIQKLYKGQLKRAKTNKVYVVGRKFTSKSIPTGKNVRIKLVDPRLKKDKRGKDTRERKNTAKTKKRNKGSMKKRK